MSERERSGPRRSARRELAWFLGGSGAWGTMQGMQNVLFGWIFVGILGGTGAAFGAAQLAIAMPGIAFALLGGARADRTEGRGLILRLHLLAAIFPLYLALVAALGRLDFWTLIPHALGIVALAQYGAPARASMLNHIAGRHLQRGVSLMIGLTSGTVILGSFIAGQIERVGIEIVALCQAAIVLVGALAVKRLAPTPVPENIGPEPPWRAVAAGFREIWRTRTVRDTILLNFAVGLMSSGAFIVGFPLIVRDVYAGDSALYAYLTMLIQAGIATGSVLLFRFMPIKRPGRVFLLSLLGRSAIFFTASLAPPFWIFLPLVFFWGIPLGLSTSFSQSIVQEVAPGTHRARILSVNQLSFASSAPVGSFLMGLIITSLGLLDALKIAPAALVACFLWAYFRTGLWDLESKADSIAER